jgi:SecD/SecF fusion protein
LTVLAVVFAEEALKQEKIWGLVILVLMALSAWVVFGTHYSAQQHRRVADFPTRFGLDIRGGVRAVLQAHPEEVPGVHWDSQESDTVQQILENRINGAGVGEATVQPKGTSQFVVELPDVKNKDAILKLLGTTAQLKFYYFADVANQESSNPSIANRPVQAASYRDANGQEHYKFIDRRTNQTFRDGSAIRNAFADVLAQGTNARTGATLFTLPQPLGGTPLPAPVYFTADQQQQAIALNAELINWNNFLQSCLAANNGQPILTGQDIEPTSQAQLGGGGGIAEPVVTQSFKPSGAKKYADFTSQHVGEIVGIVLDDRVISAPYIEGPIMDGQGEISGGFATLTEAKSLADLLNAGALPVPLTQEETQSVEASLGGPALHHIEIAGAVGLALVLAFMLFYYRLPGLVADIALLIYTLFVFAIFKGGLSWLFPGFAVTLSLPGIAGFILSIGMAVDANILIFERLKEELRNGRSLRGAIDVGFRRAFTAIRDSNICTSITCVVLLSLGTASVRGFALTLLIGVLVSLFSAITVTRTLLFFLVDVGIGNNPALFGLNTRSLVGQTTDSETHTGVNIIGRRKMFYTLSLAIIVPGLIFWAMGGLKKGIEFTGGSQIQVRYTQPTTQAAVKAALIRAGFKDNLVQMADAGDTAIVSVPQRSTGANPKDSPVYQTLAKALGVENANGTPGTNTEEAFDNVGGIVSSELKWRAIQAVIIASGLIVLYLATVFAIGGFAAGLRLGTSAIVALLHDVLVLIGVFAILGYFLNWQIDSYFITALLTVIGFSVHDTVVIFDRVRENLRLRQRGETFEHLVNRSIQQTLARSINTSLTVIMTLLALVFLAGPTTRLLNFALLIGIISGTYSSIFNAASILVDWENWLARRRGTTPTLADAATSAPLTASGNGNGNSNGGSARPLPARPTVSLPPSTEAVAPPPAVNGEAPNLRAKRKRPTRRF